MSALPTTRTVVLALVAACSTGPGPECASLRPVNEAVRQGPLTAAQRTCLQARLADGSDPQREVVSRLLLEDARHADDGGARWATLAEEHVEAFPGDVVTFVHLANHYQRKGPDEARRSLRFAQRGLSWLQRHPASTPAETRAFHDLTKARAIAAEMLAPPEAPLENRERTARYARDWIVTATALSLPTDRAIAMCKNAGGSSAFCAGQATELHGGAPDGNDPSGTDTDG